VRPSLFTPCKGGAPRGARRPIDTRRCGGRACSYERNVRLERLRALSWGGVLRLAAEKEEAPPPGRRVCRTLEGSGPAAGEASDGAAPLRRCWTAAEHTAARRVLWWDGLREEAAFAPTLRGTLLTRRGVGRGAAAAGAGQ
jgi:hypothetical protein